MSQPPAARSWTLWPSAIRCAPAIRPVRHNEKRPEAAQPLRQGGERNPSPASGNLALKRDRAQRPFRETVCPVEFEKDGDGPRRRVEFRRDAGERPGKGRAPELDVDDGSRRQVSRDVFGKPDAEFGNVVFQKRQRPLPRRGPGPFIQFARGHDRIEGCRERGLRKRDVHGGYPGFGAAEVRRKRGGLKSCLVMALCRRMIAVE